MVRKSDENEQCEIMRNELDLKGRCEADHPPMYLISIREVPGVCPSQVGCHCPKELTKRWSLLMRELEEDFLGPLRMNRQLQGTLRAQKVTYQKNDFYDHVIVRRHSDRGTFEFLKTFNFPRGKKATFR